MLLAFRSIGCESGGRPGAHNRTPHLSGFGSNPPSMPGFPLSPFPQLPPHHAPSGQPLRAYLPTGALTPRYTEVGKFEPPGWVARRWVRRIAGHMNTNCTSSRGSLGYWKYPSKPWVRCSRPPKRTLNSTERGKETEIQGYPREECAGAHPPRFIARETPSTTYYNNILLISL